MNVEDAELEYASTAGIPELRDKVAAYYNALYR
jgi:aspartate/methionine/tyrosine aminotransferase